MSLQIPPVTKNEDGEERKVGFELEFAGLELNETAEVIQQTFGGSVTEKNRYEFEVAATEVGDFRIELDARILQKMAAEGLLEKLGLDIDAGKLTTSIEDAVDKLAKRVVPIEVVMPPVPISDIEKLAALQQPLRDNKAKGTGTSLVHAFGMHINIESPNLQNNTLLRYLRAFMLLYPWLLEELQIDITRRVSPFVDHFPSSYVEKVLDPDYHPGTDQLIIDYLEENATRNRPLDMMPIFALLNQEKVNTALGDEKNNPRPTFHYRLPNSRIDDANWHFIDEWNYWCSVEHLAENEEMLTKLSRLYLLRKSQILVSFKKEWAETLRILLDLNES